MPAKRPSQPAGSQGYGLIVLLLSLLLALTLAARVTAQNSGPPTLIVTEVESQDFPLVTVHVAVADGEGLPIVGLTEKSFQVREEGEATAAWLQPLVVADDSRQPLRLVLAMDLSTPAKYLAASKKAALAFLDTLGPDDQVAILAFYNEIEVLQDFTEDRETLKAVIEGLQVKGNRTTLNAAAVRAVELAAAAPAGRKAVLMVTNIVDNIGEMSLDQAVAQAQAAQVPIYTIGIGPKARADIHYDLTSRTGGHAFVVSDPAQVGVNFQRAGVLMRQGYKITFLSSLAADGATHPFTLRVAYPGGEAQTGGRFRAVFGHVTVALEGVSEGQTVWDMVSLTCRVTASAPVTQVTYLLDDEPLAQVSVPPYRLDWDSSTASPGLHTLAARAEDVAGNEGEALVNIKVALPLVVTPTVPSDEIDVGDTLTVSAQVDTPAEVIHVQFLLDGRLQETDDTPPYEFRLDSAGYAGGTHIVTVRAKDSLGRESEASLPIRFLLHPVLPTPQPTPIPEPTRPPVVRIVSIAVVVAILLAALLTALFLLFFFFRRQRQGYQQAFLLEIANEGNIQSRYLLRGEDPEQALTFRFALEGVTLPAISRSEAPIPAGSVGGGERAAPVQGERLAAATEAGHAPAPPAAAPPKPKKGILDTVKRATRVSSALGSALSIIGSLLPRSVGTPLQRAASRMQRGTSAVSRAEQVPRSLQRAKTAAQGTPAPTGAAPAPAQPAPPTAAPAPSRSAAEVAAVPSEPVGPDDAWVQTPPVEPGRTLTLALFIEPVQWPRHTQDYAFSIISQPAGQTDVPPTVEEGSVEFEGISWVRRYLLPTLAFAAVIMGCVVSGFLLLALSQGWL